MKFVFFDKSKLEMEIITDILHGENICYKTHKYIKQDIFLGEDDDDNFCIVEEIYNIDCFTDLEHFEFIKHLAEKMITDRRNLEISYMSEKKVRRKHVQRISKENITNTNSENRGKSEE